MLFFLRVLLFLLLSGHPSRAELEAGVVPRGCIFVVFVVGCFIFVVFPLCFVVFDVFVVSGAASGAGILEHFP